MKNKIYLWGLIILVGFFIFIYISGPKSPNNNSKEDPINYVQTSLSPINQLKPKEDVVDITINVLFALNNYYFATQESIDEDGDFIKIMTSFLNQNKYLETGNSSIKSYLNSTNEVIEVTAKGMTMGANQVIKANNDMVQDIRNIDLNDSQAVQKLQYSVAKYLSDQKEGYRLITISAPQISNLIFESAKTKNPSGKIPYKITKEQRTQILDEINRLFGEELRKYPKGYNVQTRSYNSILVAVDAIQKNLIPETYEEARKYE